MACEKVKVNGVWRQVAIKRVKKDGVWKIVDPENDYVKVNGVWRHLGCDSGHVVVDGEAVISGVYRAVQGVASISGTSDCEKCSSASQCNGGCGTTYNLASIFASGVPVLTGGTVGSTGCGGGSCSCYAGTFPTREFVVKSEVGGVWDLNGAAVTRVY